MFICAPALIYLIFSITQVIIDTFKGLYNTALFKVIVMLMVTLLLNALCQQGLGVVSWFIVFIPFIFMTFIISILLYIFGLDAATGKLNITSEDENKEEEDEAENNEENENTTNSDSILGQIDKYGNIIFIHPESSTSSNDYNSNTNNSNTNNSNTYTTSPNFYVPPSVDDINNYNYPIIS